MCSPPHVDAAGLTLGLAASVAILTSCGVEEHRGDAGLQLRVEVEPARPSVGSARVVVHASDRRWRARNGLRVVVTARHPEARSVTRPAAGTGAGLYVSEAFPLAVPGEWVLTVRAELPDGRWTERERGVEVGAGGR